MPGTTPPTSQLDWLISTTAMIVLSWSNATRDLLKSFGWGIRALHQLGIVVPPHFPLDFPGIGSIAVHVDGLLLGRHPPGSERRACGGASIAKGDADSRGRRRWPASKAASK